MLAASSGDLPRRHDEGRGAAVAAAPAARSYRRLWRAGVPTAIRFPIAALQSGGIHPGHRGGVGTMPETTRIAQTIHNMVERVEADEKRIGVLSTGETLAVALVLDRKDLLDGYTMLEAVERLGTEW